MYKLQRIIGLPVIDGSTGRRLGKVLDIWFDRHWRLGGLVLKARRWWFATYYIAVYWQHVSACGDDAVILVSKLSVCRLKAEDVGYTFHTGHLRMKDLPVITDQGLQLGRISDVYFQENKGTPIVGLEITDGFISDLMEGRKWLKIPADPDEFTLGEDAIVVPARCEEGLERIVTESGK